MSEKKAGWQQKPIPRGIPDTPGCPHLGAIGAQLSIHRHAEGHEWICPCGQVFVVVSNAGKYKRLVKKNR